MSAFKKWIIQKKNIVRVAVTACLILLLAVSSVGIYLQFSKGDKKKTSTIDTNPLEWSVDTYDGESASSNDFYSDFAKRGVWTYTIDSAESFLYFVDIVNDAEKALKYNNFLNYTVYLNTSIDFNGYTIPSIGVKVTSGSKTYSTFQGTFDGGYYTIYNAVIDGDGLFGYVENATITGVGLYNCTITGSGDYVGGLVGTAVNTDIDSCYVRLGSISGSKYVGGLVGSYTTTEAGHSVSYSFSDTTLDGTYAGGLFGLIDNNGYDTTIEYLYFTNTNSIAYEEEITTDPVTGASSTVRKVITTATLKSTASVSSLENLTTNKVIKATKTSDFYSWDYKSAYDSSLIYNWCDYSYLEGSNALSFNFPILSKFNKVFMTGSFYEGVSTITVGNTTTTIDSSSLSEAFSAAANASITAELELNIIVEEVYMNETAVATASTTVTLNSVVDTTIIRSETASSDMTNMIVSTDTSTLSIGDPDAVNVINEDDEIITRDDDCSTLIIDGNKEYVKENNLKSSSAIFASGYDFNIYANVIVENNVNNIDGYGGGIFLLVSNSSDLNYEIGSGAVIRNCDATNYGGGVCYASNIDAELYFNISNCSAYNGGGLAVIGDDETRTSVVRSLVNSYKTYNTMSPVGTTTISSSTSITSGTYSSCSGTSGGGIYCTAQFTLKPSSASNILIKSNSATNGGGIYTTATLYAYGGKIYSNKASSYGGGIYTIKPITLGTSTGTYSSLYIYSNSAVRGGGLWQNGGSTNGTITMPGYVYIQGNTATEYGGGICVNSGSMTMSGGSIYSNTCDSSGGGISGDVLTMTGGYIYSNSAVHGAGVHILCGTMTMSGGSIYKNTASSGGGIYVASTDAAASCSISGGQIYENTASSSGGGIYVRDGSDSYSYSCTLSYTGGYIYSNSASACGGGIFKDGSSDTKVTIGSSITTSYLYNNTASSSGNNTYGCGSYLFYCASSSYKTVYNYDSWSSSDFAKTGYTYYGYYTSAVPSSQNTGAVPSTTSTSTSGTLYSSGTYTSSSSTIKTYYCSYKRTMTYYYNGSYGSLIHYYNYTATASASYSFTASSSCPTGYSFYGYTTTSSFTNNATSAPTMKSTSTTISTTADTTVYQVLSRSWVLYKTSSSSSTSYTYYMYNVTASASYSYSPTSPTLSGYTFYGWCSSNLPSSSSTSVPSVQTPSSTTLSTSWYAVWKVTTDAYTYTSTSTGSSLTHYFYYATSSRYTTTTGSTTTYSYSVTTEYTYYNYSLAYSVSTGGTVTQTGSTTTYNTLDFSNVTTPTKTGYTFYGWSLTGYQPTANQTSSSWGKSSYAYSSGTYSVTGSTTWYAVWKRTLTYYYNSTSGSDVRYYPYDVSASASYDLTASSTCRTGYTFYGYTTTSSFTNNATSAPTMKSTSTTISTTANTTVYQVLYRTWNFYYASSSYYTIYTYYMYNATASASYSLSYTYSSGLKFTTSVDSTGTTKTLPTHTYYTFYTGGFTTSANQPTTNTLGSTSNTPSNVLTSFSTTSSSGSWYGVWKRIYYFYYESGTFLKTSEDDALNDGVFTYFAYNISDATTSYTVNYTYSSGLVFSTSADSITVTITAPSKTYYTFYTGGFTTSADQPTTNTLGSTSNTPTNVLTSFSTTSSAGSWYGVWKRRYGFGYTTSTPYFIYTYYGYNITDSSTSYTVNYTYSSGLVFSTSADSIIVTITAPTRTYYTFYTGGFTTSANQPTTNTLGSTSNTPSNVLTSFTTTGQYGSWLCIWYRTWNFYYNSSSFYTIYTYYGYTEDYNGLGYSYTVNYTYSSGLVFSTSADSITVTKTAPSKTYYTFYTGGFTTSANQPTTNTLGSTSNTPSNVLTSFSTTSSSGSWYGIWKRTYTFYCGSTTYPIYTYYGYSISDAATSYTVNYTYSSGLVFSTSADSATVTVTAPTRSTYLFYTGGFTTSDNQPTSQTSSLSNVLTTFSTSSATGTWYCLWYRQAYLVGYYESASTIGEYGYTYCSYTGTVSSVVCTVPSSVTGTYNFLGWNTSSTISSSPSTVSSVTVTCSGATTTSNVYAIWYTTGTHSGITYLSSLTHTFYTASETSTSITTTPYTTTTYTNDTLYYNYNLSSSAWKYDNATKSVATTYPTVAYQTATHSLGTEYYLFYGWALTTSTYTTSSSSSVESTTRIWASSTTASSTTYDDKNGTWTLSSGTLTPTTDTTWYAIWYRTLIYYYNGTNTTKTATYAYNTTATSQTITASSACITGYSFYGYTTTSSFTNNATSAPTMKSTSTSITTTAATTTVYQVLKRTLTYYYNATSTTLATRYYMYNATASYQYTITGTASTTCRTGYTHYGWTTTSSFDNNTATAQGTSGTSVSVSTTTANTDVYQVLKRTLTFHYYNGTATDESTSIIDTRYYMYNATDSASYTLAGTAVSNYYRTGYAYYGWTTAATFDNNTATAQGTQGTGVSVSTTAADTPVYQVLMRTLTYYYSSTSGSTCRYYMYNVTASAEYYITASSSYQTGYSFYGYTETTSFDNNTSTCPSMKSTTTSIKTTSETTTVYQVLKRTLTYYYNGTSTTTTRYYNYQAGASAYYYIEASTTCRTGYTYYGYTSSASFTNNIFTSPTLATYSSTTNNIRTSSATTTVYQVIRRQWNYYVNSSTTENVYTYYMYNAGEGDSYSIYSSYNGNITTFMNASTSSASTSTTTISTVLSGYTYYGFSTLNNQPGKSSTIPPVVTTQYTLTTSSGDWYMVWYKTDWTYHLDNILTHYFYTATNTAAIVTTGATYNGATRYFEYTGTTQVVAEDGENYTSYTYDNLSFQTATKSLYNFVGWTVTNAGTTPDWTSSTTPASYTGSTFVITNGVLDPTENSCTGTTWYAVWNRTLTYYYNNTNATASVNYPYSTSSGTQTITASSAHITNYDFYGYATSTFTNNLTTEPSTLTSTSTSITTYDANSTVYQVLVRKWTIYNSQDSRNNDVTQVIYTYYMYNADSSTTDSTWTLTTSTGLNTPTLTGFVFEGWTTADAQKISDYDYFASYSKLTDTDGKETSTTAYTFDSAKVTSTAAECSWYAVWSRTWTFVVPTTTVHSVAYSGNIVVTTYYPYSMYASEETSYIQYASAIVDLPGYTFSYWYTKTTGATSSSAFSDSVTLDTASTVKMTVDKATWTAEYTANSYTVTLISDDLNLSDIGKFSDNTTSKSIVVTIGETDYSGISTLIPVKEGYNFTGYYIKDTDEKVYDASGICIEGTYWTSSKWDYVGDLTIYAHWDPIHYSAALYATEDATTAYSTISNITFNVAQSITSPTRTGYTFIGWTTSTSDGLCGKAYYLYNTDTWVSWGGGLVYCNGEKSYTDENSIVDTFKQLCSTDGGTIKLYANWEINQYSLTLVISTTDTSGVSMDYNGGKFEITQQGYYEGYITSSGDGYVVSYTYTDSGASTTKPLLVKVTIANIDYNSVISFSGSTITIASPRGLAAKITAVPSDKTQQYTYAFSEWTGTVSNMPANDTTITANLTRTLNQYTITYLAATGGTIASYVTKVYYGSNLDAAFSSKLITSSTLLVYASDAKGTLSTDSKDAATATANDNYAFDYFFFAGTTASGETDSTGGKYGGAEQSGTYTVYGNTTVTAYFYTTVTITVKVTDNSNTSSANSYLLTIYTNGSAEETYIYNQDDSTSYTYSYTNTTYTFTMRSGVGISFMGIGSEASNDNYYTMWRVLVTATDSGTSRCTTESAMGSTTLGTLNNYLATTDGINENTTIEIIFSKAYKFDLTINGKTDTTNYTTSTSVTTSACLVNATITEEDDTKRKTVVEFTNSSKVTGIYIETGSTVTYTINATTILALSEFTISDGSKYEYVGLYYTANGSTDKTYTLNTGNDYLKYQGEASNYVYVTSTELSGIDLDIRLTAALKLNITDTDNLFTKGLVITIVETTTGQQKTITSADSIYVYSGKWTITCQLSNTASVTSLTASQIKTLFGDNSYTFAYTSGVTDPTTISSTSITIGTLTISDTSTSG